MTSFISGLVNGGVPDPKHLGCETTLGIFSSRLGRNLAPVIRRDASFTLIPGAIQMPLVFISFPFQSSEVIPIFRHQKARFSRSGANYW